MPKIYLIGSLRNAAIPTVGNALRAEGYEAFDDWHAVGPEADDKWREYEKLRGRSYAEALKGAAARNTFEFDRRHIDTSDAAVLVAPAGKSAHLELGYVLGCEKPGFVLFDGEPERWDVMYLFATGVAFNVKQLLALLNTEFPRLGG